MPTGVTLLFFLPADVLQTLDPPPEYGNCFFPEPEPVDEVIPFRV